MDNAVDMPLDEMSGSDEWGDFSSVLEQLRQDDASAAAPGGDAGDEDETPSDESLADFVELGLKLVEEVTCTLSGVDFAFDARGKQRVISKATVVLSKHHNQIMGFLGRYADEVALLVAVVLLTLNARKTVARLKAQKLAAAPTQEQTAHDKADQDATLPQPA